MQTTGQIAEEAARMAYDAIQGDDDDRPTQLILEEHFKSAIEKATTKLQSTLAAKELLIKQLYQDCEAKDCAAQAGEK